MTSRSCVFTASILSGLFVGAHGHLRAERNSPIAGPETAPVSSTETLVDDGFTQGSELDFLILQHERATHGGHPPDYLPNAGEKPKPLTLPGDDPLLIKKHEIVFGNDSKVVFGNKVHLIMVDARNTLDRSIEVDSERYKRLHGPQGWDYFAWNAGAGKKWQGSVTKPALLLEGLYLAKIPDDEVAIYVDGSDIMYGGCQEHDFLDRFTKICNVTGAKVIAGAEYNCAENGDCKTFPSPYRNDVLQAFNTSARAIDAWGLEQVHPKGDYRAAGPGCNFPGCSLKYLNSGWIAAKARDLKWFARQWLYNFEENITYGDHVRSDQARASAVMRRHPKEVVLDYAGALVNNLYASVMMKTIGRRNQTMFEYSVDRKAFVNTVLGKDACFFHANGRSSFPRVEQTSSGSNYANSRQQGSSASEGEVTKRTDRPQRSNATQLTDGSNASNARIDGIATHGSNATQEKRNDKE